MIQSARSGVGCARRPERDALGVDLGLQDGDEGGLVLADGDGFGEVVGEVVVEGGGGGVGGEGIGGGCWYSMSVGRLPERRSADGRRH